jgi:hypothetical protein
MTIEDYIASINAVRAKYPGARVECPSKLCSISEYPGGPEVSRRCRRPQSAWKDALRRLTAGAHGTRRHISH